MSSFEQAMSQLAAHNDISGRCFSRSRLIESAPYRADCVLLSFSAIDAPCDRPASDRGGGRKRSAPAGAAGPRSGRLGRAMTAM